MPRNCFIAGKAFKIVFVSTFLLNFDLWPPCSLSQTKPRADASIWGEPWVGNPLRGGFPRFFRRMLGLPSKALCNKAAQSFDAFPPRVVTMY